MASKYGFKRPKTRQEMAASLDAEYGHLVCAKRRFRNLPDAYDDKPNGRRGRSDKHKSHRS